MPAHAKVDDGRERQDEQHLVACASGRQSSQRYRPEDSGSVGSSRSL